MDPYSSYDFYQSTNTDFYERSGAGAECQGGQGGQGVSRPQTGGGAVLLVLLLLVSHRLLLHPPCPSQALHLPRLPHLQVLLLPLPPHLLNPGTWPPVPRSAGPCPGASHSALGTDCSCFLFLTCYSCSRVSSTSSDVGNCLLSDTTTTSLRDPEDIVQVEIFSLSYSQSFYFQQFSFQDTSWDLYRISASCSSSVGPTSPGALLSCLLVDLTAIPALTPPPQLAPAPFGETTAWGTAWWGRGGPSPACRSVPIGVGRGPAVTLWLTGEQD